MKKYLLYNLFTLIIFIMLLFYVGNGQETALDSFLINKLAFLDTYMAFFRVITNFGSEPVIITGTLLLLVWLWVDKKNYMAMTIVVLAVGGGNVFNQWLKNIISRERPIGHTYEGYSFPSGHAMLGLLFYGVVFYFLANQLKNTSVRIGLKISLIAIIVLTGLSRIPLREHYPTDVLAGFAIGFSYLVVNIIIYEIWMFRWKNKRPGTF
ncbi:phosphatase PAP2 family protein [Bacillus kwashiorkori]|uniref:phosphatase PAP2 family protein n=1 Tax=Bacillus kwashiorkori TaxID=1522318 RepID=UPI000781D1CF|nr:phosphatase PAP2 family protein [Bacillus kwashiorkori]